MARQLRFQSDDDDEDFDSRQRPRRQSKRPPQSLGDKLPTWGKALLAGLVLVPSLGLIIRTTVTTFPSHSSAPAPPTAFQPQPAAQPPAAAPAPAPVPPAPAEPVKPGPPWVVLSGL